MALGAPGAIKDEAAVVAVVAEALEAAARAMHRPAARRSSMSPGVAVLTGCVSLSTLCTPLLPPLTPRPPLTPPPRVLLLLDATTFTRFVLLLALLLRLFLLNFPTPVECQWPGVAVAALTDDINQNAYELRARRPVERLLRERE